MTTAPLMTVAQSTVAPTHRMIRTMLIHLALATKAITLLPEAIRGRTHVTRALPNRATQLTVIPRANLLLILGKPLTLHHLMEAQATIITITNEVSSIYIYHSVPRLPQPFSAFHRSVAFFRGWL